jgi:hypothetical protein
MQISGLAAITAPTMGLGKDSAKPQGAPPPGP